MTEGTPARREISADMLDNLASLDVETVLAILKGEVTIVDTSTSGASDAIMRRILEAKDAAAVLDDVPGTTGSKELVGKVLTINDFHLLPSNIGEAGVFMVLDVVDQQTGEQFAVSTSAGSIMAQVARIKWLGALPFVAKIAQSEKPTAAGYYPLRLVHPM